MGEPFCKWVGGKTQLVQELLKHVPDNFEGYHEPMVGGGALFWSLQRTGLLQDKRVVLSDTNEPLMECYTAVRDDPEHLIKSLEQLEDAYYDGDPENLYYRIRDAWNEGYTTPARFIFLKQTSFNGLWRYNKSGKLNMAWGKYESPKILDPDKIRACSQALQGVTVTRSPWERSIEYIRKGELAYFDPPYWGRFDLYGPEGFSEEAHRNLVLRCSNLSLLGVHMVYTNEDNPDVRQLLDEEWTYARVQLVGSRRYINRDGQGRQPVMDMIVSSSTTKRKRFPKQFDLPV